MHIETAASLASEAMLGWSMRGKTGIFIFIHIFVAIQVLVPVQYYTGRADQNDERFAWRMFSPIRMLRCTPAMRVGDAPRPVRLAGEFHEAWLTLASRGREAVVVAMAKELCARNPGQPVSVELACRTVDGKIERRGGSWDMCALDTL